MSADAKTSGALVVREFEGQSLRVRIWRGRPVVPAAELGVFLGYRTGRILVDNITGAWSDEFVPSVDFEILKGDDLKAFEAVSDSSESLESLEGGRRSLLVVTETGARLAAIKARTPHGKRVRRWLAELWAELDRAGRAPVRRVRARRPSEPSPAPPPHPLPPPVHPLEAPLVRALAVVEGARLADAAAVVEALALGVSPLPGHPPHSVEDFEDENPDLIERMAVATLRAAVALRHAGLPVTGARVCVRAMRMACVALLAARAAG